MKLKPGYKLADVGVIPEEWESGELGSRNPVVTSGSRGWAKYYSDMGTPFIRITNLSRKTIYPDLSDLRVVKLPPNDTEGLRTQLENGDLLISITADVGIIGYVDQSVPKPAYINQHIALLRFDAAKTNTQFLSYYLASSGPQREFRAGTDSGAKAGMNLTGVKSIKAVFPPLPEQRTIATALSDVDTLVTKLDQLITKKRDLKQAAMQQLLTGKTRLPGFTSNSEYKHTEVGLLPSDWDVVTISFITNEFRGGAPLKPTDFTNFGVKVLPKGGVSRTGKLQVAERDIQYCSQEYAGKHPRNQVNNAYTIVVLRDLVPSGPSIGLMVEITTDETFVLAQGVYGFKVNESLADGRFLIQLSNTNWYRRFVNSIMVGSTQVHITNTAFKKARIPLPQLSEQIAIAAVLSDMDTELTALEARREKTLAIKQGMMQELLTGRIRLV